MKNKSLKEKFGLDGINFKPIFTVIAILCITVTIAIDYQTPLDFRKALRISLIGLFFGLIVENYRITRNWRHVIYLFIGTYVLSLSLFLINKGADLKENIIYWPYYFIVVFLFVSVGLYSEKITQKITEGTTLLFSLAFAYWLLEKGLLNFKGFLNSLITLLSISFLLFSIFNSLSYKQLSKTYRLVLSLWTSIILLIISLDNSYSTFKNDYSDFYSHVSDNMFVFLSFFLLGISSVYLAQNINLIYTLLDKDSRRKAKRMHVERFSETQILKEDSIFCIVFSIVIYFVNFRFKLLPMNLIIWLVIFTFPFLLESKRLLLKK